MVTLVKNSLWPSSPVNFAKFLKTLILGNVYEQLRQTFWSQTVVTCGSTACQTVGIKRKLWEGVLLETILEHAANSHENNCNVVAFLGPQVYLKRTVTQQFPCELHEMI